MTSGNNYTEQMQAYMKQFKKNIEMLVEQGLLKDAKQLLDEYEKIVPDDVDIYSIRGVIAMIEGDLDEAEEIFKQGLKNQFFNFDLVYNLGYLNEVRGKFITAYRYYYDAHIFASDENSINQVNNKLNELLMKEQIL